MTNPRNNGHIILTGVGTCTTWVTLLNDNFCPQGIMDGNVSIIVPIPQPANSPKKPLGFYVKPSLVAQNNPHPPAITQNPHQVAPTIPYFGNHTVVSYSVTTTILSGGGIFDPSYGKEYPKNTAARNDPLLQWQKDSVDWMVSCSEANGGNCDPNSPRGMTGIFTYNPPTGNNRDVEFARLRSYEII